MTRPIRALLALLVAAPLAAQEKPAHGTPNPSEAIDCTRTLTGYTLASMRFELDGVYSHADIEDWRDEDFDLNMDTVLVSAAFGITDWLTAKALVPIRRHDYDPGDTETGIGDVELQAKVSIREGLSPIGFVPLVDLALGLGVTLPTGDEDEGLGEEEATFRPFAAASYWFKEWFGLHGSAYFQFQEGERPYHGGNAAVEFVPWTKELSLLAALELRRHGTDSAAHTFIPGAEYRFTERVSAGIGFPIGLSNKAEDWGLILNVQIGL